MAKPERGLPKSFDIRIPDGPVRLGDYLDEVPATPPPVAAAIAPAPEPPPPPAAVMAAPIVVEPPPPPVAQPLPPLPPPPPPMPAVAAAPAIPTPVRRVAATPPRKQFNMAPETLRMLDELLAHVRTYSAERDLRASELVHALVLAMHEVRPYLDLTDVQPRGKWGSPTAAALPLALKDAFQKAVVRSRRK